MPKRLPIKTTGSLAENFAALMDPVSGQKRIEEKLIRWEKKIDDYLKPWLDLSRDNKHVYPSQGLLQTPYDELPSYSLELLPQEQIIKTLRLRLFFLEMFNHPYRINSLEVVNKGKFTAPPKVKSRMFDSAFRSGLALSIGDIGASVNGFENHRVSRRERYASGPFIKLGQQARIYFCGSASPDVWNSSLAIATMAACHGLAEIPRNGILSDIKRQADVAKEVFQHLSELEELILDQRSDREAVAKYWRGNVAGVLSASGDGELTRAEALYGAGVRSFRIYSPEPGTGPAQTSRILRKKFGREIEIFAGQVVSGEQAKRVEAAGADGVYVGIGGGGRCVTGVRSGSVIDWPELVWRLRGEIDIPVIIEGGASDHVAVSLLMGASGISVSRIVAGGTIESPGGALYCRDSRGKLFKPYGGEASARTKYLDGKFLPFGIASFVEGETTKAEMSYVPGVLPTLTYNLHLLIEDSILALVFRGAKDLAGLHAINPSPLRQMTSFGQFQQKTH